VADPQLARWARDPELGKVITKLVVLYSQEDLLELLASASVSRAMLSVICLAPVGGSPAQEHRTVDFNFEQPPEGVGVGIVLGDPSGLSVAYRAGEHHAVQVDFGYNFNKDRVHLSADYLYNV
jgi:hypothetical protein